MNRKTRLKAKTKTMLVQNLFRYISFYRKITKKFTKMFVSLIIQRKTRLNSHLYILPPYTQRARMNASNGVPEQVV